MKLSQQIGAYTRSIFEIAKQEHCEEPLYKQLQSLETSLSEDLFKFFENPGFTDSERQTIIDTVAEKVGLDKVAKALLILLVEHRQLRGFSMLVAGYRRLLFDMQNKKLMQITSAKRLPDDQKQQIVDSFKSLVGGKLEIEEKIDEDIIGGVVVQIDSKIYDGSIRGRLNEMKNQLLRD